MFGALSALQRAQILVPDPFGAADADGNGACATGNPPGP
jgi:hypothetical protein